MSAKRLSTKELLAERNPLARPVVAPVDIYDQINEVEQGRAVEVESKSEIESKEIKKAKKQTSSNLSRKSKQDLDYDPVQPYSTYIRKSQVKLIKHRAVDNEVKDQHIVQAAIDEYFARHSE